MEAFLEVLSAATTAKILLSYRNTICMLGQFKKKKICPTGPYSYN